MEFFLDLIGIFIIFLVIDYKRPEEYKLKLFTKHWWISMGLLIVAIFLIENF